MKYLLPLLILINSHEIKGVLEWTVVGKVTDYGQNVTLFCHVPNCCPKDAGWDRWTPNQRTLFIDVKTGRLNKKYDGKVEKDGYTLVIQNLTKNDLNVSYSCLYGVTLGEQKYLLAEDVFTYMSTAQPNVNDGISKNEVAGIIVGVVVLVAVALSVGLLVFHFHRPKNNRNSGGKREYCKYGVMVQKDQAETDDNTNERQSFKKVEIDIYTNQDAKPLNEKDCFLQDPDNVECMEGEDAILKCVVRSGSSSVKWSKDGIEISQNESHIMSNVTSEEKIKLQLTLKNAKRSDSGDYIVVVGKFSRKLHLIIKSYFLDGTADTQHVECREGNDALFACTVCFDSPSIILIKDDIDITGNDNCKIRHEGSRYEIKLTNTKASDKGEYFLQVGKSSRKIYLNITEIPSIVEKYEYMKAIQYGKEVRQYVRIQVIGKDRVGKSSLVRRLLGQNINDVKSTDGIEINRSCKIRTSDGKWTVGEVETEIEKIKMRIHQAVSMNQESKEPISEDRHPSEGHVYETEKTPYIQKRSPSEDGFLKADKKENKPLQSDENKTSLYEEDEYNAGTLNNKNEINITDKKHNEKPKKIDILENQHPVNSEKNDQMTKAVINRMNDILLYVKNKKEKMISEDLVECGIWDFAGQRDYYATHQTFFTPHAIYILVTDITDEIKPIWYDGQFNYNSSGEYIDFWLDSIHCFRKYIQESTGNVLRPPVIVVCTGIDKVTEDKEAKKTEFENKFLNIFGCQDKGRHIRGMIHFISNTESPREDFEILQNKISEIAKEMHYFAENLPTQWIQLESALAVLKDLKEKEKMGYCEKWENIEKLAQTISMQEDELRLFLNYQHKIGNVIYFEDKPNYIILQPNWLVDCFRCLVCNDNNNPCTLNELLDLKKKGIISEQLIVKLFGKVPALQFVEYKSHILEVMEKFDIIIKSETKDSYYMPCMVSASYSIEDIKKELEVKNTHCTPWLVMEFGFLPIAYYNQIVVNYIRQYIKEGRPVIYAGKVVVYLDQTNFRRLSICFSRNAISLQIWKWRAVNDNQCRHIIEGLCSKIEELNEKLLNKLDYKIKAKCSNGDYCRGDNRLTYGDMSTVCEGGEYRCEEHKCNHNNKDLIDTWLKHVPVIEEKRRFEQEEKTKRIKEENLQKQNQITWNITDNPEFALPFVGTSESFIKLLSTGTYESFENRVLLCGSCACGKSTLASTLIGSLIPLTRKSTDGLVIHSWRNGINLETLAMVPLIGDYRDLKVLTEVIIGKPNRETSRCKSYDTHLDQHIGPFSRETNNPESNLQALNKNISYTSKVSQSSNACIKEAQDLPVKIAITSEIKQSVNLPKMKNIEAFAVRDDILKEVKSCEYKVKIAPSDLVVFDNQRSYDMISQLFIQHVGTFVVMFDGSRDFHEPLKEYPTGDISNECIVKHWVNSILNYCVDDDDVMPKILFAATHCDLLSEDMQKRMKKEFSKKVTEMFGTHEMKKHIVFEPVFFINGTDKHDQEIQNLKKQLVSIARNQPSWGLRQPLIWVPLELLITNMQKDNVYIIFKSHLAEANKMNGNLALSEKQLHDFLLTQHALGKIMFFDQPELHNFVILYPPALVNILRSFTTDEMLWPEDETLRNILRNMMDTGKLYKKDLLKLWEQNRFNTYIPDDDFKEFIIQVLIHLDVLILPKRYSGKSDDHVDYYLVPCAVKAKMPMSFLDDKSFANRTLSLVYRFWKLSLTSALSFKLIGAVSSIWPIMELNGRPLLYHSAAVLCVDDNIEFRIIVEEEQVVVYLTHVLSKSFISPDIAASIQECLTSTLEIVLKIFLSSIRKTHQKANVSNLYQIKVGEVCGRSPCVVFISDAKRISDWLCGSGNQHSSKYPLLWVFNQTQNECPANCLGLSNTMLTAFLDENHLSRFADQLTYNSCRELVFHLGLTWNDWEYIEDCYRGMSLLIKFMALYSWKTKEIKEKPTKTVKNLLDALRAISIDIHILCKVFRESTDFLLIADVRLQEIPHDDVLEGLVKNLGNCAIQLGIVLGVTISSINETMVRHHKDMYGQISDILRKWKSSSRVKPTIYRLMLAVERVNVGGLDYLKDLYRAQ